jgi:hypothetical protein
MKKIALAAVAVLALALPTAASAKVHTLDPAVPGSAKTAAEKLIASPPDLLAALLPEYAFEGGGPASSPVGFGDTATEPPFGLADFPTNGDSFTILSSGDVNTVGSQLTNEESGTTTSFENQKTSLIERGSNANDWTVLKVDVNVPAGANCMALDYRFLSEEFPEYVGSPFNDAFIAELDTTSWSVGEGGEITRPNDFAVSPEGSPVSINGLGETAVNEEEAAGTYFDAATGLVTTKTPITEGAHSVYLSIFDASDSILDSAVFVDNLRFINESPETCKPPSGKDLEVPPPGATPLPPPPPSNLFIVGPSVKFKKGGTKVIITVTVPGPGTLGAGSPPSGAKASASRIARSLGASASKAKGKGKCKGKGKACKPKPLIKPSSVTATAAGPVSIVVSLSGTGKAKLAKQRKLSVPVQLTFTPVGGVPASQTKVITFKKPKCKGAKCKGKGK